MQAVDVMTAAVITVGPDAEVAEIARLLLRHRISGLPVTDAAGRVLGIVSEGDLIRRIDGDAPRRHSWWLGIMGGSERQAQDYVKAHGHKASEIMSREVVSVEEATPIGEVARLLEEKQIKRVPVLREGKLVGIVSRANLLHGLATGTDGGAPVSADDRALRDRILRSLPREAGVDTAFINVTVKDGVVRLWGAVTSESQQRAAELAARETPGVKAVHSQLARVPAWIWAE